MNIVLFTHPRFAVSTSMPRFAKMIEDEMIARGHVVLTWTPRPLFYNLYPGKVLKKWFGYIDLYVIFPIQVALRIRKLPLDTIFVFSDQALGMWVPFVAHRPHVIHVHDLTAYRSSIGELHESRISWTGIIYQKLIYLGFNQAKNFLSVSRETRRQLHRCLLSPPKISRVIYNGVSQAFKVLSREECIAILSAANISIPEGGFILNVGGNQWYKNRIGVLDIYRAYSLGVKNSVELWMVGAKPSFDLLSRSDDLVSCGKVKFITGLTDEQVCAIYNLAKVLLFPSLYEGFGWPIAEAFACGCPVITTKAAPMTEVGGSAAIYIPMMTYEGDYTWPNICAAELRKFLELNTDQLKKIIEGGFEQLIKFDPVIMGDKFEECYKLISS